ncbi:MAG TPA: phenylalanine--tRNA ligase subunit alpha, partial [Prolixibacteraceae bacterium]|nr:phenylalanine--tRNA ligase subunit alpha [Prolixibacteraceae bacterium]
MLDRIKSLHDEIACITAANKDEAEELRIKYLSKKGLVSKLFDEFKNVPV